VFQTEAVEKIKTQTLRSVTFFENGALMKQREKNMVPPDRPQMTIQYGACILYSGKIRLQTHTKKTQKLLFFDGNNGYTNACHS